MKELNTVPRRPIGLVYFIALLVWTFTGLMPDPAVAQEACEFQITDPTQERPQSYVINDIRVEGASTARDGYLISTSGMQVGNQITIPGEEVPEAVRRIYRTSLFSDVQICVEPEGSRVNMIIRVQEQPRLEEFHLEGIKRSHRRELEEQITLLPGFAVTNSAKQQAIQTIRRYYQNKGHWFIEVETVEEISDNERNRSTLTFQIDPGQRIKIGRIRFEGNEEYSDRDLRKELGTIKEDTFLRLFKRYVHTEEDFEEAMTNLRTFYRENGFRDFRILSDSVYVYDHDHWIRGTLDRVAVDIEVHEGPQYRVRNITWEGNSVYTDEQLSTMLDFREGDVFNQTKFEENLYMRRDENDITSNYQNIGYLFFEIVPDVQAVGENELDIRFDIIERETATVRDVSFSGNTKTHDDVVRRNLRTMPGQTYSRSAIMRTVRELSTVGYFNPEGIEPNLNPNQEERTVDVSYRIDESQSTDNFEFSGGFGGRYIGIILAARVNFNNFSVQRMFEKGGWNPIPSGDGQKFSLGVQVTGRGYQSYSMSFQEPWLRGRPTSLGFHASYDILNYEQIGNQPRERNELFSAGVSIGRPQLRWPDDFFSMQTSLSYQLYNVAGFAGIFPDGDTNILSITHQFERNSLDNFISPRTGSKLLISGEVAPPLPGFAQYYKLKSEYQNHTNIAGDLTLTGGAQYGYMGYFGSGEESLFQRYFLGGTEIQQRQSFINDNVDMRGYPGGVTGVISPLDENRNLIGGRVLSKYSLELRYPAVSSEQLQLIPYLFADAGNTFLTLEDFDPFDVKRAVGFGARLYLPILGLVDLSYGYRMDGTPSSNRGGGLNAGEWEFLFNIGAPF